MKTKKAPPNIPDRGDRCALRGNPSTTGTLRKYDPDTEWATVEWDAGIEGPTYCHRFELVTTPAQPPVICAD